MPETNGKNIVLCSDGTGNTMMKGRGTNVWKLYEAVDLTGHRWEQNGAGQGGVEQIAFYDDGVGSQDNKILKIVGGAFGYGLQRNILDLYKSLCRAYSPGDRIYIFGFSRGAYTARVLAGMILSCGILKPENCRTDSCLDKAAKRAYKAFRAHFRLGTVKGAEVLTALHKARLAREELGDAPSARYESTMARAEKAGQDAATARSKAEAITDDFRRTWSVSDDEFAPDGLVEIEFVGVWDTVAAVGLPFKALTDFWNRFVYPFMFPDYQLSPRVLKGCHALAIDDERLTFHPMLWDERDEEDPDHVEQVWFAGVHSNVGGGYPKQGLSLVSLDWMMRRARDSGLVFLETERQRYRHLQNVHDKLYDSRSGLGMYYRYSPRDVAEQCLEFDIEPKIHVSVMERIALATQDYAPGNLPAWFVVTTTDQPGRGPKEAPEALQRIVEDLGSDTASHNVRRWMKARQYIYLGFLAMTLGVVALAVRHHFIAESSETWVPASWDKLFGLLAGLIPFGQQLYGYLVRPFLLYFNFAVLAFVILALFYVLRRAFVRKLHMAFADFWRIRLPGPWW
jgi:uncharacterized protein (DUF2235 family)